MTRLTATRTRLAPTGLRRREGCLHRLLSRMAWTTLCDLDELVEDRGLYVDIGGRELAVFLHGGKPYVLENTCPHAGGSLSGGHVEEIAGAPCAVCPVHGWSFRLADGEYYDMPGFEAKVFPVRMLEHEGRRVVQADLPMP